MQAKELAFATNVDKIFLIYYTDFQKQNQVSPFPCGLGFLLLWGLFWFSW